MARSQPTFLLKENDGRGGRKRKWKFQKVALVGVLVVLSVLAFKGGGSPHDHRVWVTTKALGSHGLKANDAAAGGGHHWHQAGTNGDTNSVLNSVGQRMQKQQEEWEDPPPKEHREGNYVRRRRPRRGVDEDNLLQDILHGRLHLMDVRITNRRLLGKGGGMTGVFCRLEFHLQKSDPSSTPMFHSLISKSPDCAKPRSMDFYKVVRAARKFDEEAANDASKSIHILNLTAVVFHMSRCGSTLASNLLVAANPEEHRVYSESNPPAVALLDVCDDPSDHRRCNLRTASRILADVVYLMSRSSDPSEKRVFFKFQSISTTALHIFQIAFPDTPWLFVYRNPVHVMQSQLRNGVSRANCVQSKYHPPARALEILNRHGETARSVSSEGYCAVHLASITESAVNALNDHSILLNYQDLPGALYDVVQRELLGRELSLADLNRMEATATMYSKGKNKSPQMFEGDSEQKEASASTAVKNAAATYLTESYLTLEAAARQYRARRAS
jgi:hypothetical protein